MQIVAPSIEYKKSYLIAIDEAKVDTGLTRLHSPIEDELFEDFVKRLNDNAQGLQLPVGYVPSTTFWLIEDMEFIGWVQIRHNLAGGLFQRGGHIGYYIRVSKRKMGYGKKILELGLKEAKKLNLEKVSVTCDDNNLGSIKVIESNGGILEDIINLEGASTPTRRYWIELK
jgi:predicted acetyltransferase